MYELMNFSSCLLFCGIFVSLHVISYCQFVPYQSCVAPSRVTSCFLNCDYFDIDLTDIAVNNKQNYNETVLQYSDSNYDYEFIIPICGYSPSFDWIDVDIYQIDGDDNHISLGTYNSSAWSYGLFNNSDSLQNIGNQDGDYCDAIGANRQTTFYFICREDYTYGNYTSQVTEISSCFCKFINIVWYIFE